VTFEVGRSRGSRRDNGKGGNTREIYHEIKRKGIQLQTKFWDERKNSLFDNERLGGKNNGKKRQHPKLHKKYPTTSPDKLPSPTKSRGHLTCKKLRGTGEGTEKGKKVESR